MPGRAANPLLARATASKNPSDRAGTGRRRARARVARKEIRAALARARAGGVPERDLPVLISRRTVRRRHARP
jgi:hypothetical protein